MKAGTKQQLPEALPIKKVDIRPGVSVLAVLRHLNYKPWFALGEFVDNAVQSFIENWERLEAVEGSKFKLKVDIAIDATPPARIFIRDNAAGIALADFPRAFRPAAVPPNRSGLSEFGMGMKSAACWFAPEWSIRTSSLGDPFARTVHFEIANIIHDDIQELDIKEQAAEAEHHFTEVILENVFHVPVGRTIGKLKEHLSDIYRVFIRKGALELSFNGEPLSFEEPPILTAPYFKTKDDPEKEWRKDISFDLGDGISAEGFAALREPASTARAGFALFRRGRLIQGSGDEGYRPPYIFGQSNSYRYQRLFGELHLKGFDVSHTKDGIRWDENEQPFLEMLRDHLDSEELPLLKQAEGYRSRAPRAQMAAAAKKAVANAADAMKSKLPGILPSLSDADIPDDSDTNIEDEPEQQSTLASRQFEVHFRDRTWSINVELTDDPAESEWLRLNDSGEIRQEPRTIGIRLALGHPFMMRFAQTDAEDMEALLRVAAAIALAEILARDAGVRKAGTIRRNINDILADALSEP